jgi:mannose-6-phosphate isomerase-like protein (cupin superfamily)
MIAVVEPRAGEVIGDAPDRRVEILSDHDSLNATWSRFGPGRDGADLHIHRRHTDLFYVLDGRLTLRLGHAGEELGLEAGTLVRVPPLVVHGFRNASDAEVRYLNLHAPGRRFADYLRALRDGREFTYDQEPPPEDGVRSPADVAVARGEGMLAEVEEIAVAERSEPVDPRVEDVLISLYVLEGELAAGDVRAGAGAWLNVPAGTEHAIACDGRYLEIRTPAR